MNETTNLNHWHKKGPFTFASGSCLRWASRIASDTWSHILSVNIQNQAKENYLCLNWGSDLVVFLQLKCCIVKITFPINFVNHGLMRKSAAQYLCLQIANLPLTVNILLLYNSLWVELYPKRLFFLLDKFSASVCHQELQVQQHPMWPRPLDASCQMTGKTWNHIGYEKLRSQQLNKN